VNTANKKIFGTLFFSIFSAITGVGIVIPLLPVYAHNLGASGLYISMIFGAFSISRTLFLPLFGRMSDEKGRKPFIMTGLFCYALVSCGFIFSKNVQTLIALRLFQGIASAMVMPVVQAYVGSITPPGKEGFFMGLFSLSMFLSLSLGPLLGGTINEAFGLNYAFGGMGILAFSAFLLSFFALPATHLEKREIVTKKQNFRQILLMPTIAGLFTFRFVYTTCVGMVWCFLPLYGEIKFNLGSTQTGLLVMTMVLVGGVLHAPMGFVADRLNKKAMIVTGGILITASMLVCGAAQQFDSLLLATVLFGLGGGISLPALSAMAVIEGKKINALGSVMSALVMGHSLGMLTGSMLAGLAMDYLKLESAFPVGAGIMLFGGLLFIVLMERSSEDQAKTLNTV
jgi:MFS family permease